LAGAPVFRKNDPFCGCRLPGNKVRERLFSHLEVLLNLAFRISFDLAESPLLRAEKTAHFRVTSSPYEYDCFKPALLANDDHFPSSTETDDEEEKRTVSVLRSAAPRSS
jgi:hypothetical protein